MYVYDVLDNSISSTISQRAVITFKLLHKCEFVYSLDEHETVLAESSVEKDQQLCLKISGSLIKSHGYKKPVDVKPKVN